jgi:hypothetical protein
MKKISLLASILLTASVPEAYCTSVTWGAVPTARQVVSATNITTAIASPSLVLAGTFANETFSLASADSLLTNFSSITSSGGWQQFALGQPATLTPLNINASGRIGGSLTDNTSGAAAFNAKPIYLMVFNASTVGAATQMGIFRSTDATAPWVFPANGGGVGDTFTGSTVPTNAPTMVAIGGFGSTATAGKLQLTNNFDVAPVPEPSTFAVGVLSILAAAGMRSRRQA